jgi:imidazolonepropionase
MLLEVTRERPAVLPADRATLLIEHASELVTLGWSFGDGARGGLWQGDPGLIHDGAIAIGGDGRVLAVGPTARVRDSVDLSPKARIYDASGCSIVPGFIDSFAEAIVADPNEPTTARRRSKRKPARPAGDPILASLSLSERDLIAALWRRLDGLLLRGTTGIVLTSGYMLDPDDEISLLKAVQAITEVGPLSVVSGFRAAGITPGEHRISADEYVKLLTQEVLPDIGDEDLASLFTLAADHTTLTLEQTWRVLRAAQTNGLRRRLELSATSHPGVLDFADEMGVGTIVLLDEPSEQDMERLADSEVTVVISVGSDGVETWGRSCARRLIELGVPLALGTGGGPIGKLPVTMLEAIRFACGTLGLTPAEALIASTINGAFASGLGDDVGPLEPGKCADLLILGVPSYTRLPYEVSDDPIKAVVKDGWLVVDQGARVA